MVDTTTDSAVLAIVVIWLMNWVKRTPLMPWITDETSKISRTIAFVLAALAGVGIHISGAYQYDPTSGAGHLVLDAVGLTLANVIAATKQLIIQQTFFRVGRSTGVVS